MTPLAHSQAVKLLFPHLPVSALQPPCELLSDTSATLCLPLTRNIPRYAPLPALALQVREYMRSSQRYTDYRAAAASAAAGKKLPLTTSYSSGSDSDGEGGGYVSVAGSGAGGFSAAALLSGETSWPVHVTVAYTQAAAGVGRGEEQQQQQGQQGQGQAGAVTAPQLPPTSASGHSFVSFADEHQRVQFGPNGRTMRQLGFSLRSYQALEPEEKGECGGGVGRYWDVRQSTQILQAGRRVQGTRGVHGCADLPGFYLNATQKSNSFT